MIRLFFRTCFYFTFSFLILSLHINKKSIFYHIDHRLNPFTASFKEKIDHSVRDLFKSSKKIGKKLFTANVPPNIDKIKQNNSALEKSTHNEIPDSYSEKERKMLQRLLDESLKEGSAEGR